MRIWCYLFHGRYWKAVVSTGWIDTGRRCNYRCTKCERHYMGRYETTAEFDEAKCK